MPQFLLFARDAGLPPNMSPEAIQKSMQKYHDWTRRIREMGKLVDGNKLADSGKVLVQRGGKLVVTDGPYAESKELLGGYWVIEAANADEVVRLASDSPHLEWGTLEIRQIEQMSPTPA